MKKYLFFFSLIIVSYGQDSEVTFNRLAEDYFLLGMRQYSHKDFTSAVRSFQSSIDASPLNHRITAAMVMKAKSLFALKSFRESSALCDSFEVRFPASEYIEDILFTRGICDYNEGDYVSTVSTMEKVFIIAKQRLNQEHSLKVLEHVAAEYLKEEDFDTLIAASVNGTIRNTLIIILAERSYTNGNTEKANTILKKVSSEQLEIPLRDRAKRLRTRIERGNNISIGVLLPLMTNNPNDTRDKKIAAEVLEGIQFALTDYEERIEPGQVSVEIDIRDTERNPEIIRSIIDSLSQKSSTVAVIGPVFSDETMSAAAAAMEFKIPMISPTATDDSVAMNGEYVFQANSTSSIRGKILAQYAVKILGAKRIAILASTVPFAKTQADSFAAEVVRLGGTIVLDQRYQRGEADLRSHFRSIRSTAAQLSVEYFVSFKGRMNRTDVTNKLVQYGFSEHFADSVIARSATVNLTHYIGVRAQELADSLKLPMKKIFPFVDSLNYPVSSIDVIFSPIGNSQQIGVISSQIAYYNIKTTLLGTSEWNNIHELDLNRRYADGVIFGSERWIEMNERTNSIFAQYAQKYNRQMSDNILFGYDVMSLIISLMNEGALTREHMVESLSKVMNHPGIRNSITLQYRRVNSDLHILQYKNGIISKLRTLTYQP